MPTPHQLGNTGGLLKTAYYLLILWRLGAASWLLARRKASRAWLAILVA
jgi:hypothetical protein